MVETKQCIPDYLNISKWLQPMGLRGGSWNNNHENARVADRNNNHPNNRNDNIGFRVVSLHNSAKSLCQECPLPVIRQEPRQNWPAVCQVVSISLNGYFDLRRCWTSQK